MRQEGGINVRKKVLGRGLEALLSQDLMESVSETERIVDLDIGRVDPNPNQPRGQFDREHLEELAASIKNHGVLQPVVVKRKGDRYQLVIGERRLRASKLAGKMSIPAIVREVSDNDSLKYALMENLQREDLNPIEEANGYNVLKEDFGISVREIADIIGKNRSTVANTLRLLKLPVEVRKLLGGGDLKPGHARVLLAIESEEEQISWARRIVEDGITVRETERGIHTGKRPRRRRGKRRLDPQVRDLEEKLEMHLGTRIRITPRRKGGLLSIEYYSEEELEGILEKMGLDITL